ncbi:MAG TPA: BON domain-containing protein [Noviherbaspirillum sp.]
MKNIITTVSALLFAGLLGACASTESSRATGQVFDDAALTAKVKTQIAQSQGVGQAAQVNVDAYRGVVMLSGFVDSTEQKRDLGQAALKVSGVEKVFNNLQVKPEASGR